MIDRKPELMLYRAHCHADGCSEGDFRIARADDWTAQRYQKAMQTIERYMCYDWGLQLSGMYDLVGSEKEAQELIAICQKEFERVNPTIQLYHCAHGRIIFDRKAEFGHHTLDDRDDLIEKMKDWDYMKEHHISPQRLQSAFYPSRW
ncbi:MAG: hypothetical protein AABY40_02090 [Nanoarchaeota archaeon]